MKFIGPLLVLMLAFSYGCNLAAMSSGAFRRVDENISGFTKHYQESTFLITQNGKFGIEMLLHGPTKAGEMKLGENEFLMIVHDDGDQDTEGAEVSVTAQMPGAEIPAASVVDEGGGRYRVAGLLLPREGALELEVRVRKRDVEDSAVFPLLASRPPAP